MAGLSVASRGVPSVLYSWYSVVKSDANMSSWSPVSTSPEDLG